MKKYLLCFICFIFAFFVFSIDVDAKVYEDEDVVVVFGDNNNLYLNYPSYNKYSIDEGKFYYNGNLYSIDSSINDGDTIVVEGETLTYNALDNVLTGETNHYFYGFHIYVQIKTDKTYTFTQELCYKYGDVSGCNIDKGDKSDLAMDTYSNNFFYGFLPFYNESIVFDYVYFNFTFTNVSNLEDKIEINDFGFNVEQEDVINYKDSFKVSMNNYGGNHTYNGIEYIEPQCFSHAFNSNFNQEVVNSITDCNDSLALTLALRNYASDIASNREYKISFDIFTGEGYSIPYSINSDDIYVIKIGKYNSIFGEQEYYYLEQFNGSVKLDGGTLFYIPLDDIIEFNRSEFILSDISFKLDLKYVCKANEKDDCNEPNALKGEHVDSYTYYFDLDEASLAIEPIEGNRLPGFSTIASQDEIVVKVNAKDFNGFDVIEYFISSNSNESNLNTRTYIQIQNGDSIVIDKDGFSFIYVRVRETSKENYKYFNPQEILIDKVAPSLVGNNFNSYKENEVYKSVGLNISFKDDNLDIANTQIRSKAYYLILKEDEKDTVGVDDIIGANVYTSGVTIDKNTISEDGRYLVCFVLIDYLANTSDKICSFTYNIDISALRKEEVSVTGDDKYVNEVKTTISISDVSDGVSFKCGLAKGDINSQNELGITCYNNKEATLKVNDEAIYYLWIYAADKVGNYSLIKLDNPFYIDSLAPRVTTSVVNGDNTIYSNDVKINVNAYDLNQENITLQYQFYLSTPSSNDFVNFNIEEGISYPYDYYGSYKLAIKACDVIGNCKTHTDSVTYLIDTAKIIISLIGEEKISILQYQKYIELGANASKGNSGKNNVELDYTISGSVDSKKPGIYKVTYSAGEGMNRVSITREIEVKSSEIYIIGLISLFGVGEAIILARLFIKKRKNDNI